MTDNERKQGQGREGEGTTMRLPAVGAPAEPATDVDLGLSAQDQATVDALVPGTALLVVLRGPNTGARFLLDSDEVSSGRHPDSDIFLDDVTVSRKHATFRHEGDDFLVRDVGSLNGTYVNKERIDEITLRTGDEVQIGKFRLVFYAGAAK
jgi:pSer/pThr/pTyr-binding forkhead associated (FHA) protein